MQDAVDTVIQLPAVCRCHRRFETGEFIGIMLVMGGKQGLVTLD